MVLRATIAAPRSPADDRRQRRLRGHPQKLEWHTGNFPTAQCYGSNLAILQRGWEMIGRLGSLARMSIVLFPLR
jgi:hypothetical protein